MASLPTYTLISSPWIRYHYTTWSGLEVSNTDCWEHKELSKGINPIGEGRHPGYMFLSNI